MVINETEKLKKMESKKITSLKMASERIDNFKQKGQKIVLCYGLFNFLHIGHIRYLKEAKECGDILVVAVCTDKFVAKKDDIQFEENLRTEAIASLDWVDLVLINPYKDLYSFIDNIKPDIFVQGFESKENNGLQNDQLSQESLRHLGVEPIILQEDAFVSTSRINRYIGNMPEVVQNYLQLFKQRYSADDVILTVEAMHGLRVMVVGDTILDEYQYCTAIGKSSKDPMLALKYESHDLFAGGVLSVANHVANFVAEVDLITILGAKESYESFIRSQLNKNVNIDFLIKPNAPTLIKRRFVDGYSMNKLFEIYVMDDSAIEGEFESKFCNLIRSGLKEYDLVIVADFGHGTISNKLKELLAHQSPYLAVNAQSNAGNRGFNNITKYPHANYISMAEHEIRVEMRDMSGKIRKMMETLIKKMNCDKITVTRGRHGCMVVDNKGEFVQVPSFTQKVVDRVGAGDALFAVTSLAAAQNAPCEIIGFLGNVVGSLAVEIMGNQKAIESQTVIDFIHRLA